MIKKIAFFSALCFVGAAAFANDLQNISVNNEAMDNLASKLDEAATPKTYPSTGSSENSVRTLKYKIELDETFETITGEGQGEVKHPIDDSRKCSFVLIDENWLIGSSYCFSFPVYEKRDAGFFDEIAAYYEKFRTAKNFKLDGQKVSPIQKGDIILINIAKNKVLKEKYAKLPKANIYIPKDAKSSAGNFKNLKFITSRRSPTFGIREAVERDVAEYCTDTKCIKVEFGFFNAEAQSGDPLFVLAPNNMEFIIAFNTGDYKQKVDATRSRKFKELSNVSYSAIEEVVSKADPEGWKRIKKKVASTADVFSIQK